MTSTTLRAVTLKTVANYRHAAERAVGAYRAGGHRLIEVMRKGVDQAAQRGAEPYVPGLAAALRRAGDNMGSLVAKGVEALSERSERVIEMSSAGVTAQVKRVADLAGGVDNRVVASGLQAVVRMGLPGAQVALALSERVASGADKLADVAAGPQSRRARVAAKRVRRAAPGTGRAVAQAVQDVAAEVEAGTRQAVRRTRAKATQATEAVAAAVTKPARRASTKVSAKVSAKPVARRAAKTVTAPEAVVAKPARRAARKVAAPVAPVAEAAVAAAE